MMHWQYYPYVLPLLFGLVILIILGIAAWQYRKTLSGRVFFGFLLALIEWTFCYMLELSSVTLADKIFWDKAQFIGIVGVPLLWLEFAIAYTGRERWLSNRIWPLLLIPPAITLILVTMVDSNRLMYDYIRLVKVDSYFLLEIGYTGWFWVHAAYSYALLLSGTLLFGYAFLHASGSQRLRVGMVLIGAVIPWFVNILFVFHILSIHVDLTAFSFTVSSLLVSFSLFHFRLFNLRPVAYNAVIESMSDGLIVLDPNDHVVGINPSACRMINISAANKVVGQSVDQALNRWPDLVQRFRHASHASEELVFDDADMRRHYNMRISTIYNHKNQRIGRLIVLNNITPYINTKNALQVSEARLHSFASALLDPTFVCDEDGQYLECIVPKNLPPIPGFPDLRGHYFHEVLPPLTTGQVLTATRNTIQTGQFNKIEYVVNLPGGDLWFEGRLAPIRSLPGQKGTAVLIAHDITARRQAENAVQRLSAQLNNLLHHYVPRVVTDTTISEPETVHLGGIRREVTVLFADLHGFTHWSESRPAEEIIQILNRQMSAGVKAILIENGTIDKLMGDTLMAAFNTPQEQPDHALRAIRAAQAILALSPEDGDIPPFSIGIHTGIAVAGNVGNERVMNYIVIGSAVNQARHLQELAQPGQILLSPATHTLVKNQIAPKSVKKLQLTQGADQIEVYEWVKEKRQLSL
jgi:PAS domain S-box-containing protein